MAWQRFERRFWGQICRTQRQAERIAFAATVVFLASIGMAITATAAWLLSLE